LSRCGKIIAIKSFYVCGNFSNSSHKTPPVAMADIKLGVSRLVKCPGGQQCDFQAKYACENPPPGMMTLCYLIVI
jgi:hypothetical protein